MKNIKIDKKGFFCFDQRQEYKIKIKQMEKILYNIHVKQLTIFFILVS